MMSIIKILLIIYYIFSCGFLHALYQNDLAVVTYQAMESEQLYQSFLYRLQKNNPDVWNMQSIVVTQHLALQKKCIDYMSTEICISDIYGQIDDILLWKKFYRKIAYCGLYDLLISDDEQNNDICHGSCKDEADYVQQKIIYAWNKNRLDRNISIEDQQNYYHLYSQCAHGQLVAMQKQVVDQHCYMKQQYAIDFNRSCLHDYDRDQAQVDKNRCALAAIGTVSTISLLLGAIYWWMTRESI